MPWADFEQIFSGIDVCDRTTNKDLQLDTNEGLGACGVVWGCIKGLCAYLVCCAGLRTIYCGHVTTEQTKDSARGCCSSV